MDKRFTRVFFASLLLLISLSACGLLRAPEEASAPIEAIPLELATATTQPDEVAAAPTSTSAAEASPTAAAMEEPTPTSDVFSAGVRIFTISQADSEVRFELDEDLRGNRITVVGVTDQVAGEFALNFDDLSQIQVGVLQINARALLTDNDFRNRAIQNEILRTGQYEFITFTPTAVTGLPASAATGDEINFTIAGDLTIRNMTKPVVFNVTAAAVSDSQISGTASAVVLRADFELNIPSVPNVANVEEEVELFIDFKAIAK